MGLTLDDIVDKQFKIEEKGSYNQTEVDDFLDEILAEMEKREKITNELKNQVTALSEQINSLKEELSQAKQTAIDSPSNNILSQKQENTSEKETLETVLTQNQEINTDSSDDLKEEIITEGIVEKFLNENKLTLHNQVLDSLGLYKYEKEYAPETLSNWDAVKEGYDFYEAENGITRYYKRGAKKS